MQIMEVFNVTCSVLYQRYRYLNAQYSRKRQPNISIYLRLTGEVEIFREPNLCSAILSKAFHGRLIFASCRLQSNVTSSTRAPNQPLSRLITQWKKGIEAWSGALERLFDARDIHLEDMDSEKISFQVISHCVLYDPSTDVCCDRSHQLANEIKEIRRGHQVLHWIFQCSLSPI